MEPLGSFTLVRESKKDVVIIGRERLPCCGDFCTFFFFFNKKQFLGVYKQLFLCPCVYDHTLGTALPQN